MCVLKMIMASADLQIPDVAIYNMPAYAANKIKRCPRIFPRNGGQPFLPNDTVLFELPAQGYMNPQGTTLAFDVYMRSYDNQTTSATNQYYTRLQPYIGSIFKSLRIKYGASYLETIEDAGYLFRNLKEVTFDGASSTADNMASEFSSNLYNSDQRDYLMYSHGIWKRNGELPYYYPNKVTVNGINYAVRRYQIHLPLGLLKQTKLIPLAFMASQFAIEFRLAPTEEVLLATPAVNNAAHTNTGTPTYFLDNVTLHPELLEFDARFDDLFFKEGILKGGVPLQFNTWNTYIYPVTSNNMSITIPERSRSLKSVLVFMRAQNADLRTDYGASFGDFNGAVIDSYQYRIGNSYYPASPVVNTFQSGFRTGSVEPYQEFMKVIKNYSDQTAGFNNWRWNFPSATYVYYSGVSPLGYSSIIGAADKKLAVINVPTSPASGLIDATWTVNVQNSELSSGQGSTIFCFAIDLESSNGAEISGLNAEEQSDINLNIKWNGTLPESTLELVAYCNIDQALLIKDNNRVEHII